jgi:DNA-binding protein H-NS
MARRANIARKVRAKPAAQRRGTRQVDTKKSKAAFEKLRKEAIELARSHGTTLRELFGRTPKGKSSLRIKYRDPQNPANTWAGRGRMPRWLAEAIKSGKKREDFLV